MAQAVIPIPIGVVLVPYAARITTNTTTTPTSATCWVASIVITTEAVGTTSTIVVQNKEGTPKILIPSAITTAVGLTTYSWTAPLLMTSGIDIVTAGVAAATVDIFISYYQ